MTVLSLYVYLTFCSFLPTLLSKVCGDPGVNFTDTSCSVYSQALNETRDFGIWLSGTPECSWYGVTCSADGIVRAVELINNNLAGVLPHELTGKDTTLQKMFSLNLLCDVI